MRFIYQDRTHAFDKIWPAQHVLAQSQLHAQGLTDVFRFGFPSEKFCSRNQR